MLLTVQPSLISDGKIQSVMYGYPLQQHSASLGIAPGSMSITCIGVYSLSSR